jgi:hypothetical protein
MGPVGSGKTSGCLWHIFFNAQKQHPDYHGVRNSRYAIIRSTYPQLKSSTIRTLKDWFKDKIKITYSSPIIGRLNMDLPDGTRMNMELMFVAVEDENATDKLRSWEFTGAYVNEAHEVPEYLIREMLPMRTNRFPAKRDGGPVDPFVIFDFNAIPTEHWLYQLCEVDKPGNLSFYKQPPAVFKINDNEYVVNPKAENLNNLPDKNYYADLIKTMSYESINTDLMNNYGERRSGRPVYREYNDREHALDYTYIPVADYHVYIGVDQGLTPAAAFTQQFYDGTVYVFDEISTEDCSLKEFVEDYLWPKINAKYPQIKHNFTVVCDPATAQRSMNDAKAGVDILRELGLPVKLARTNSATERRESVVGFLRLRSRFKVSPVCHVIRKGFISDYKYDKLRGADSGKYKENPTKNAASHVHDALQYAMLEYANVERRKKRFQNMQQRRRYAVASSIGGY